MVLLLFSLLLLAIASPLTAPCHAHPIAVGPDGSFTVTTSIGPASGLIVNGNVAQLTVKYATAQRFQPAVLAPTWMSSTAPPPACPQKVDPSSPVQGQEDCLFMNVFIPLTSGALPTNLPVLAWIHGGSFIVGSASDPGLNASALAVATKSVVVVPQYRLGALGFLPPASQSANLGAKDILSALQFIKQVASSLGASQSITLAGQSSGATLIRSLLGSPSAAPLFKNAWLHSDPMAYGFNTPAAQTNLQTAFYGNLSCNPTGLACQQSVSLDELLTVQWQVYATAATIDPSTAGSEPIRVVHDGQFITSTLTGSSFPSTLKPIVLTTVNMEAGPAIYENIGYPMPAADWTAALSASFSPQEIDDINNSGFYPFSPDSEDVRPQLVNVGTDQIWRCPTWTFARSWAQRGGIAYTGVFDIGSVYPDSASIPFCTSTNVCHEGDIETVFATIPSPSSAQSAVIRETQARYSSFIRTSNPNAYGFSTWSRSTSGNLSALQLGGSGPAAIGGCQVGFFGGEIQYYYQIFNQ